MSEPEHRIHDALDEELVAYLDGETDGETTRRLEQLISSDPAARDKLRSLERVWDALEELPRSRATDAFTTSTVEMIAVSEAQLAEAESSRDTARRIGQGLVLTFSLLALCTAGYAVGTSIALRENRQLLEHLPLIERLDQFQQIDNIEYLRQLRDQQVFGTAHREARP